MPSGFRISCLAVLAVVVALSTVAVLERQALERLGVSAVSGWIAYKVLRNRYFNRKEPK
jgi:hypothetical protein